MCIRDRHPDAGATERHLVRHFCQLAPDGDLQIMTVGGLGRVDQLVGNCVRDVLSRPVEGDGGKRYGPVLTDLGCTVRAERRHDVRHVGHLGNLGQHFVDAGAHGQVADLEAV